MGQASIAITVLNPIRGIVVSSTGSSTKCETTLSPATARCNNVLMRATLALLLLFTISTSAQPAVSNFAGTGEKGFDGDGGPADKAKLDNPFGLVRGPDAALYVCDSMHHVIRRIDGKSGVITTVAGTPQKKGYAGDGRPATAALLNEPYEVRFDRSGNLFFVERMNHTVRRVDA